jgi:cytochrome c-type biogenesis protein
LSVGSLVSSGPLLLAIPVAAAAGAVTFLSPCVLPLVPGYLSYITGMSGTAAAAVGTGEPDDRARDEGGAADTPAPTGTAPAGTAPAGTAPAGTALAGTATPGAAVPAGGGAATATAVAPARSALPAASRGRALAGAALFVLGFSALFALYGAAFGGLGAAVQEHAKGLSQILGFVLILLGLLFAGAFDRFSFTGRIVKPSLRPRAGLATAPVLGVLFGLGWTPCIGPTLSAVLALGLTTGTAARGAFLAFVYALGVGVPFLLVAFAVDRGMKVLGFARRHARLITRIGGLLLIAVGVLEVTGAWSGAMTWLKVHWLSGYNAPF